jgi:nucleolar GTP-binding protein
MSLFSSLFFFKETWDLANDDEKYDVLPEVWNGHNVADFIDPEIMEKLNQLEAEEEKLEKIGYYDEKEISDSEELKGVRKVAGR